MTKSNKSPTLEEAVGIKPKVTTPISNKEPHPDAQLLIDKLGKRVIESREFGRYNLAKELGKTVDGTDYDPLADYVGNTSSPILRASLIGGDDLLATELEKRGRKMGIVRDVPDSQIEEHSWNNVHWTRATDETDSDIADALKEVNDSFQDGGLYEEVDSTTHVAPPLESSFSSFSERSLFEEHELDPIPRPELDFQVPSDSLDEVVQNEIRGSAKRWQQINSRLLSSTGYLIGAGPLIMYWIKTQNRFPITTEDLLVPSIVAGASAVALKGASIFYDKQIVKALGDMKKWWETKSIIGKKQAKLTAMNTIIPFLATLAVGGNGLYLAKTFQDHAEVISSSQYMNFGETHGYHIFKKDGKDIYHRPGSSHFVPFDDAFNYFKNNNVDMTDFENDCCTLSGGIYDKDNSWWNEELKGKFNNKAHNIKVNWNDSNKSITIDGESISLTRVKDGGFAEYEGTYVEGSNGRVPGSAIEYYIHITGTMSDGPDFITIERSINTIDMVHYLPKLDGIMTPLREKSEDSANLPKEVTSLKYGGTK